MASRGHRRCGIDLVSIPDFAEQVDRPERCFPRRSHPVNAATPRTRARQRLDTLRRAGRPRRR
ncbi:hypothetical protein I552_0735 [Mycobacterium xenopi 3993]|nr:hypothetical protein I552_0735 [Mycobacterium xenopi 3993]